jgi:ATP-dependent Clp protease protease subunit
MVSSGTQGTVADQQIALNEGLRLNEDLHEKLALHTGKSKKQLLDATTRDNYMSATEAKKFGLVDHVVNSAWK